MSATLYLAIPLMAVLVVLQATILPRFPIFGVIPQFLFLLALAWGMIHGWQEGIVWAFVAGILLDLLSAGPLGVTSLAMLVAVGVASLLQKGFPESRIFMPVLLAFVATVVFWLVYLLLLRIVIPLIVSNLDLLGISTLAESSRAPGLLQDIASNYGLNQTTLRLVLSSALVHSLLILPIYWLINFVEKVVRPRPVEI
jgi:rod shape-determining protein MreD